ncbi:ABC transporter substrate-binding protein [Nonomuraea spiralis]|uniref:ABC transporter substrate-binding protein n=1 Tax=Nonomuraea spiralis TaxID=46182 RepID=A0ABV5IWY3_9ACTN|nr:ABC transporter substrate-binding protein [Nonomuraea spiralis]GGS83368.1 twin-arginine translocation pathway signal protein [Nonomuraea spiralis]
MAAGQASLETLDPLQSSNADNDIFIAAFYDRLVGFDSNSKMIPKLASSWEFNSDATAVTLTLRDDVVFHSGNKLTAEDVKYSLDRAKRIASGSVAFIPSYASSKVVDDTHVTITFTRPSVSFLAGLSYLYIVDSKVVRSNEGADDAQQWLATHDAGSGPYVLSGYKANQEVGLSRYDKYWDTDARRPQNVVLRMMNESSLLRDELLTGNVDLGWGLAPLDVKQLSGKAGLEGYSMPSTRVTLATMNTQGKVTRDPRVREAIQLAYDYEGHIKTALQGSGEIARSVIPRGMDCVYDGPAPARDVAKAKQLLGAAGAAGATVSIAYDPAVPEFKLAGTLLENSLREIGLVVKVKTATFPQYMQMISAPATTPDIAISWDFAPFPDAGSVLDRSWNSKAIGQTNGARYDNAKVDSLLAAASTAKDQAAACEAYVDAQKQIVADHAAVYIAWPTVNGARNGKLAPLPYTPTSPTFDVGRLLLAK